MPGGNSFASASRSSSAFGVRRRNKIDAVGVDFDDLRAARVQPVDHLLQQLAADLGDARGRVEIGEVALRETEIAVEAVDQDFEGVLQRVKILLLRRDPFAARMLAFASSRNVRRSVSRLAEDLELIGHREAVELQHDARDRARRCRNARRCARRR